MAIVYIDGFDYLISLYEDPLLGVTETNQLWKRWELGWNQGYPEVIHDPDYARRPAPSSWPIGYLSMSTIYPAWIYRHFNEDHFDTLIVGFAFYTYVWMGEPDTPIINFFNMDDEPICGISAIDGTGRVRMFCGGYEPFESAGYSGYIQEFYSPTNVVEQNTWYHVEAKWVFDDTTGGSMEARVNEVEVINQSGIKTYKTGGDSEGNYSFSQVKIYKGYYHSMFLDDLHIFDGEGTVANDFVGDVRVDTIYPEANGDYAQFTPVGGSNYECVQPTTYERWSYLNANHLAPHTSYRELWYIGTGIDFSRWNESETLGDRDCYNHESMLSLGKPIYGIQQNSVFRKTDAGKKQAEQFLRIASINFDTGNIIDASDFSMNYYWPWTVNPNTLIAWTESDINALQSGLEIVY